MPVLAPGTTDYEATSAASPFPPPRRQARQNAYAPPTFQREGGFKKPPSNMRMSIITETVNQE